MKELIIKVAELRNNRDEITGMLKAKKEAFEREYEELITKVRASNEKTKLAEELLRKTAEEEFMKTKQKNFFDGNVKILETTKINFDEKEAFEWAKKKEMCLMLDSIAIKKLAKAAGSEEMPFVKITVEPRGNISRNIDLEKLK